MIYVILHLGLGVLSATVFYLKFDDYVGAEGWESRSSLFILQTLIYPWFWLKLVVIMFIEYLDELKERK